MVEEKVDALTQRLAEHMAMPFPPTFRGLNIEGQDMVTLDADAYGYALGVVKGAGNEQLRAGLTRLISTFDRILPAIDDEYAIRYYTHVRDIAVAAAEIETFRGM